MKKNLFVGLILVAGSERVVSLGEGERNGLIASKDLTEEEAFKNAEFWPQRSFTPKLHADRGAIEKILRSNTSFVSLFHCML